MSRIRIGVLASGRGTDFQSIVDSVEAGELNVDVAVLICNNPNAPVLERAAKHGVEAVVIDHRGKSREAFEEEVVAALKQRRVDLVVFAGFTRIVTSRFINAFPQRIINIHPSLLPAFPGTRAQRDALAFGVKVSGLTIHFVDESVDGGPIILQKAIPVRDDDTEESLSQRILEHEHVQLPFAIRLFAEGRIRVEGRRVRVDRTGLDSSLLP